MTAPTFYYCATCELVYLERDTHAYYATGFPTLTAKRACPTCADALAPIADDDADLSIVDYLA